MTDETFLLPTVRSDNKHAGVLAISKNLLSQNFLRREKISIFRGWKFSLSGEMLTWKVECATEYFNIFSKICLNQLSSKTFYGMWLFKWFLVLFVAHKAQGCKLIAEIEIWKNRNENFPTLVFFFSAVQHIEANPDAKRLYDDLLSNYNRLIRPVVNNTETLTVWLGLKITQIIEVSLRNQVNKNCDFIDRDLFWDLFLF